MSTGSKHRHRQACAVSSIRSGFGLPDMMPLVEISLAGQLEKSRSGSNHSRSWWSRNFSYLSAGYYVMALDFSTTS
jgi:hypothetical protein